MKKLLLISAGLLLVTSSCINKEFAEAPNTGNGSDKEWNKFDFATSTETNLNISYQNMGGITAPVYFEIYDTCPVRVNESGTAYVKIDGIEPLYANITKEDGTFTGETEFPSYLKKVYVYTPAFYALTLIETQIEGNTVTATDYVADDATAAMSTRASYDSDGVKADGWKTYLGNYDKTHGKIQYAYKYDGTGINLKATNYSSLYLAHSSVIDTKRDCPEEYRSSKDLRIELKEGEIGARVGITFLGSNTCWNSSMGYYFYKDGQKPASLKDANVIMIFPNTQDGQWSNNVSQSRKYKGVDRGTTVKLMYYPDIDNPATGTDLFPDGYRIGFVLACNGWQNRLSGFTNTQKYRAATSDGLSLQADGRTPYSGPRTAVYRYTDASKDINSVMFSFEDHDNDENFSDVVFTLVSDPVEAVVDIPSVDQDGTNQTVKTIKGVYSFEDLWPSRGDFDMNDVMVKADYVKTFNNKGISEESFVFKTFDNLTGLKNGLGITLSSSTASADLHFHTKPAGESEYTETNFTREGNVILLTENVRENINASYKITATHKTPVEKSGTAVPFIYSTTRTDKDSKGEILHEIPAGQRWELHLPFEAPSDKVDWYFFGKSDDRSIPREGIYYVREQMYPFSFFLSGATETDLSRMLDPKNEKKPIDELYPGYTEWAKSQGQKNKDWYKQ